MARLTWDEAAKRIYETGVDQVVLFLVNTSGSGDPYLTGKAWNGVTGITESPEGADANDIYADNMKYLSLISKENWKGTIKAYTWPKEFNECQGEYEYDDGTYKGIFFGQQTHTKFALAWRTIVGNAEEGDAYGFKIHVAYGLSAAPSEKDHATENESPEATEFSWDLNSIPEAFTSTYDSDGQLLAPVSHIVIESKNNDAYDDIADKIFGSDDNDSTLPTPDELAAMLNA